MDFKNFLAVFFIIVFLGKLVTIDGKFVNILFNASGVTLVNKLCPKKQLQTDPTENYNSQDFTADFEIDYLCHAAFDIEMDDSPEALAENNFESYSYRQPANFSIPWYKFYPPPKA